MTMARRTRYATVTDVVPMEGRTRGYAKVLDAHATLHYFYDPEFLPRFPDLKAGDRIEIEYTSSPSRGGWHIVRVMNDEVLDNEDVYA